LIVHMLSSAYGAAVTWRRRWYARDPARARRLDRPVISVGNLSVGGSGKTPVVAHLATLLLARGERPSILTRGYARPQPRRGVTIVSDGARVLEGFAAAGDEPLMLARALPGVPVLVGVDRFASGQVAEQQLKATVHLLDDGFQHVRLARTVDLVLVDERDLSDRVLPAGRLREPLRNAAVADAVVVAGGNAARVARQLGLRMAFSVARAVHEPRTLTGERASLARTAPVLAFAGIARPERFFDDLERAGWHVADRAVFGDHHAYTQRDVDALAERARAAGASLVTTEKDAVRLSGMTLHDAGVAVVPLTATIQPADEFLAWLLSRLA
jgi:tetraacyldisaccharide 4'-kinase